MEWETGVSNVAHQQLCCLARVQCGQQAITQVAFSCSKRNLVAVAEDGGAVKVFDTSRLGHVSIFNSHTSKATGVAFYPNDKLLLSCGFEGNVVFYDLLQMKWGCFACETIDGSTHFLVGSQAIWHFAGRQQIQTCTYAHSRPSLALCLSRIG